MEELTEAGRERGRGGEGQRERQEDGGVDGGRERKGERRRGIEREAGRWRS